MNEKKLVHNFKSYINVSSKNNTEKNGAIQELKPKLLSGEAVAGSAHSVVLLTPFSGLHRWKSGSLFVTNYKLTFIPVDQTSIDEPFQKNFLLGVYDVPLSAVESVYSIDLGSYRRRRLLPFGQMPNKIMGLQVVCKNMRVLNFKFDNSPIGQGRTIAMALIHHAFPKRHDLLFAYENREPYYPRLPHDMNMFQLPNDWKKELERCKCPHWRITCINETSEAFMTTASGTIIVPSSVLDYNLIEASRHFRSGRVPIWVWGRPEGAALLRSGELSPTEQSSVKESVYLEQVRRSHPKVTPPHVIHPCGAAGAMPALAALHAAYRKLIDICTPTPSGGFSVPDSQYYSALEASKWLRYVSGALALADAAAARLAANVSVVLQEGDGVDYCAVVSSLTQLLIDPHFRTISGFQSLIQKEWVALGHPFCDRLGLLEPVNPKAKEQPSLLAQPAPVFLLFLDCVWQLQNQFPVDFEFSEIYLTTLWDCCHNQFFDTFLFNAPKDRLHAVNKNFVMRPLWDWGEQFSEQDIHLFRNPLFANIKSSTKQKQCQAVVPSRSPPPPEPAPRLEPNALVAGVELWAQCYERWLRPLDALGMGPAQYHLYNDALVQDIHRLKEKMLSYSIMGNRSPSDAEPEPAARRHVPRFFPFSARMRGAARPASELLDSQPMVTAPD